MEVRGHYYQCSRRMQRLKSDFQKMTLFQGAHHKMSSKRGNRVIFSRIRREKGKD